MTRPIGAPTYRGHTIHPDAKGQTARETVIRTRARTNRTASPLPVAYSRRLAPKILDVLMGRRMSEKDAHKNYCVKHIFSFTLDTEE
jgi:hypothetical protein|tara:strand:- start:927 stop:1187 length:261 start_codon:yes stop_codon:yes gene_type:complete